MNFNSLHIAKTEDTPEVRFDDTNGDFEITGRSLPEDAYTFYRPIIDNIGAFLGNGKKNLVVTIQLDYFNSSSGRYLMELLVILDDKSNSNNVSLIWKYEEDDELMLEKGEEFKSLINIPFNIIMVD